MAIRDPIRFEGTLTHGKAVAPLVFSAGIDDEGGLRLDIEPIIPGRLGTPFAPDGVPLQSWAGLKLTGRSADGWEFASDTFYIGRWSRPQDRCEIEGDCSVAELSCAAHPEHKDMRAWFVRKLGTFHGIEHHTPLGRLVFRGYREMGDQVPSSLLALHADGQEVPGWWDESERFLIHLARVLSFACSVYVLPVYEQRVRHGRMTLRTVRRAPSPAPYMPPFDPLSMWQIVDCAIRSFDQRPAAIEQLEPAIRWLTAAVAYEESRLVNAMSALESILARSGMPTLFIADAARFDDLKRKVRKFLKAEKAPGRMGSKVDELNRRSFRDRLEDLLRDRAIETVGLPDGWLDAIIDARNVLIHTGVAPELHAPDARLIDRIVWAREIATRIMLEAIGFAGQYQSWVLGGAYASFPGCRPMSEIAAETAAASAAAT